LVRPPLGIHDREQASEALVSLRRDRLEHVPKLRLERD
jgi:hypothetical protein